jgi:carbamoyltransferase
MVQIGIHNTGYFSSASIFVDGKIVYASAEERLSRVKFDNQFPFKSIENGLKSNSLGWDDVDEFLIAWNPTINASQRFRAGFSRWVAHPMQRLYSNINAVLPRISAKDISSSEQILEFDSRRPLKIKYINHHYTHIGISYFTSGFDEAAIYIADGYGENATAIFAKAKGEDVDIIKEIKFPHSIGMFYAAFTEFLGFEPEKDEWKVMGAAAYGNHKKYVEQVRSTIIDAENGNFELDLNYFNFYNYDSDGYYSQKLISLIGDPIQIQKDDQAVFDLAASVQFVFEEVSSKMLSWLHSVVGSDSICLGGGTAMNCLYNGKIESQTPFKNVHIPFAPDDVGNAIGALLWVNKSMFVGLPSYLGASYDEAAIAAMLDNYKIKYTKYEQNQLIEVVAGLLCNSKVVGWFQGRSEFGQRALGNRSILADPRDAKMKDRVNSAVKYREAFRPFAPAVLHEDGGEYFEDYKYTPNMERILNFTPSAKSRVKAVVHDDGTGRLQSVTKENNSKFHSLITAFKQKTGVSILLNTSFNLAGEPIVSSPTDALRTFFSSGLDILVLENFLIMKENI